MKRALVVGLAVFFVPFSVLARTPNDFFFGNQWFLPKVQALAAWDTTTGSREVVVAVIDTGVDLNHPDFAENLWKNTREIPGDRIDNDLNGYVDDVDGWDFVENDNNPSPTDQIPFDPAAINHGTLVAGIIGAVGDNSEGVTGISWQVKIMPLRILNALGSGTEDAAIAAVNYAVANGAEVINLSFTGDRIDNTFSQTIKRAYDHGVVVVAAVGNDGRNGKADLDVHPIYPACLFGSTGEDWVIGVAASTRTDEKADFSNYGKRCTDIAAPGLEMFGPIYQNDLNQFFRDYYRGNWQGTSTAAPVVTGAVALLLSRFPSLTPEEVKIVLQLSVDPLRTAGTPHAAKVGAGRLNIARAFEIAPHFAPPVVRGLTRSPVVFAAGPGARPEVNVFNAEREHLGSYLVYDESFTGGVTVTVADIDQDGEAEIVVVPASEGTAHVRWFEMNGALRGQFQAFAGFRSGFDVAVGDIGGDGQMEFVVSAFEPTASQVEIYSLTGELVKRLPMDPALRGAHVAVGDVDGKLGDEIVLTSANGLNQAIILRGDGTELNRIEVFNATDAKGVTLALGDVDGNGRKDIVVGSRDGVMEARAFTYQGTLLWTRKPRFVDVAKLVQVGVGDIDGNGTDDLLMTDDQARELVMYKGDSEERWKTNEVSGTGVTVGAWTF
ncbi:S8 family serine peptidase [Candidatus Uhrbacteria bacterium]|nr:S8 family serine peptidase [Candidatus Uhrbacteria bacterium]